MLSQKARSLQVQFENLLMNAMCDTNYESCMERVETDGMGTLEIKQAYYRAVMYAASAHIENCFDTCLTEGEINKGSYLDPQRYIDWMNQELKQASFFVRGK